MPSCFISVRFYDNYDETSRWPICFKRCLIIELPIRARPHDVISDIRAVNRCCPKIFDITDSTFIVLFVFKISKCSKHVVFV